MKATDFFVVYKTSKGLVRKDGSTLVKSYGCNGIEHRVQYSAIWFNDKGVAIAGKAHVLPDKVIGKCLHNQVCKNYGAFILM